MTSSLDFAHLTDSTEAQQLGRILCQCFNFSEWDKYSNAIGLDNFRLIRKNQAVAGGLCLYFMGQWLGGNLIPVAGVAAVGIAPEHRGGGVAFELLSQTLKELYHQKIPISILYPATQYLYRRVGFEQAGTHCTWELPLSSFKPSSPLLPIHRIEALEPDVLINIYRQFAQYCHGYLDRNSALWKVTLTFAESPVYGYRVGSLTQPEGYVIFEQRMIQDQLCLVLRDWASLTTAATESIFSFIASHRSQVKSCRWFSGVVEPRLFLLPEQTAKIIKHFIWMLRIVNVIQALELRAYPLGIETELHLSVTDDIISENQDHFILKVADGKGEVSRGGRGEFRISIRGLASLYTGFLTAQQLKTLQQIETTDTALIIANQLFTAANPAIPDFF